MAPLKEPLSDFRGQIVDIKLPGEIGLLFDGIITGVDLRTRSLEVKTKIGLMTVPADSSNFIFRSDKKQTRVV